MSTSRPLPTAPTPFRRTPRRGVVALSGALGVVLVLAATAVVLHATTGSSGSASPEDAVRDYFAAEESYDCAVLVQHPISGYEDRQDCEADLAQLREEYEDEGIDPDSLSYDINFVVSETMTSEDLAAVTVDISFSHEKNGATESAGGGFRGYDVGRTDDGGWVVLEWVYED